MSGETAPFKTLQGGDVRCACVVVKDFGCAIPQLGGEEAVIDRFKLVIEERETEFNLSRLRVCAHQLAIDANEWFSYGKHLPKLGLEALLTLTQRLLDRLRLWKTGSSPR